MSRTVSGVSIIATNGPAGRYGLTVSSMVSVSAEPPSLLVAVNRKSTALPAIVANGSFSVSVLSVHQRDTAMVFAGRDPDGRNYDFRESHWSNLDDLPRVRGCSACFDCIPETSFRFGTHEILVGRVVRAAVGNQRALLYTNRDYGRAAALADFPVLRSPEGAGVGLAR